MPVDRRFRAPLRRRHRAAPDDSGFSLVEVIVAVAIIGVVMAAVTNVLVGVTVVTSQQSGRQTAIKLAADGIEDIRDKEHPDLDPGLGERDWPVENQPEYQRRVLIQRCWQAAVSAQTCGGTSAAVSLLRVTATVTWTDKACPGSTCTERVTTLINATRDTVVLPAALPAAPAPAPEPAGGLV